MPSRKGFTLVELLVVVTIVALLAGLSMAGVKAAMESARKTAELNAARNLVTAFLGTASDNEGTYLAGMDMRVNATTNPVYKPNGELLTNSRTAQRYPYRIAPYLSGDFEGTILVNNNGRQIDKMGGSTVTRDYYISAYPALGLNIYCVGGVVANNGAVAFDAECVTTPARMASVLVFASAGIGRSSTKVEGYSYVTPPTLSNDSPLCKHWSNPRTWSKDVDPMDFGYVDFRYDGKAVCAFLDGSVRMHNAQELSDMRLWSRNALSEDDSTYELSR